MKRSIFAAGLAFSILALIATGCGPGPRPGPQPGPAPGPSAGGPAPAPSPGPDPAAEKPAPGPAATDQPAHDSYPEGRQPPPAGHAFYYYPNLHAYSCETHGDYFYKQAMTGWEKNPFPPSHLRFAGERRVEVTLSGSEPTDADLAGHEQQYPGRQ